jgi:hypothetical protein
MPDIIITPSTGKLEFIDDSSQIQRRHSFSMDDDDGIKIDAPFRASSVRAPLNVINVTVNNSNVNYPFVLASGSAETGIKTLMMDGSGGTYNPFTNTATIDISGNSATTTLASNSTNLGGVAAASYVTLTGTQTLTNKTITGTFTGNLTGTGSWATNAVNANTATNSTQLNGQAASYYTNIPARLGYTPVNQAGDTVTGNLIINGNFTVNGATTLFSASNVYISSSQLYIEDNILTLNAFSPYLRYAGVEMYDSGSGTLSSLLWDGEADYFFLTGSSVNGKIITGPDGQTNLSSNYIPKATAGYKLGNSLLYDNGTNVGIGTTTPSGKLSTGATSGMKLLVYDNAATGVYTGLGQDLAAGNSTDLFAHSVSNLGFITFGKIGTNGSTYTEWARFNTSGSLGIGTTSPNTKLAVNGVSSFGPSSKLSMIGLDINSGGTPTYIKIVTTIPVASPSADFTVNIKGFVYGAVRNADISISWHYYLSTFYNPIAKSSGGWAPTIRLSAENGFVAIVLSSPGYWPKFYVESMYSSAYTNQYASGWSWTDADATGNPIVNVPYASNFGNGFVMLTDGNVGIGITSPTTKLHVVGVISGSSFSGAGTGLTGTAANLTAGTATIANGVSTGAVKSGGLEENSVITSKIADGNVTNVKLASSSVTIGSSAVSLGSTLTTIAGLTSVTSTTFVGALTGNASTSTTVNGTNGQLLTKDVRTIAPNNITNGYFQFGFTSWTNNNNSPYADYLHLRSYTDSSGGNDNLVMFRKDVIGMRIWQQTFGSATNYSSYKDVCWTDGTNASGTWAITSSWATNALNVNNATLTVAAGTGISLSATPTFTANASVDKTITITNGGVTSAVAGIGVGVSGATGAVTFSIGQAVGTGNSPTFAAVTTSTDGANHIMAGTTNAEGIRMTPASSTTYPVFLRSINPGVGEASPWIYKEQATDWGIWHNNPVNSIDFTKQGSVGISTNVGGSSTNAVTVRVEMATGFVQTIAGYRNSAGTTILDNNGNITGNAATATILQTARNIGGVSFNGSADINLPGVNTAGNQNTSGNAATATTATNANAVSFTEVELNAPVTVSGTWSSGNGSEWGEPKFGTSFNQFRYTDGNGPYVEYNIPANHHACFISQLQWDTGGYADCHGVQSDGDLVFLRRINTRQLVENSNHGNTIQHDGATVSFVGSGLQAFTKIRITNRSGRIHMTGIAFTRQIDDGYEGTGMVHPAQISHQGSGSGLDADLLDGYNSATANTANTIVLRDASGNFSAGTITATLSGTATTANALNTSNSYTGVNFTATGFLQTNLGQIKSDTSFALLTTTNGAQSVSVRGILLGTSYDTTPGANEIRTTNNTSLYLNARGTGDIQFQTADSLKMMLLNNGNVGIGTSSPSSRVHIYENANRVTYIAQNNNHIARFEAYGTATAIDTTASNGIFFRINGGDIVKFAADGNVGIGTNTVTAKVESYFSSNAVTINYLATNLNNNSPIPVYGFDVTNGSGETRSIKAGIGYERHLTNGRGTLHFYNDSTNDTQSLSGNRTSAGDIKMSIDNGGNVGINTTSPSALLNVRASTPTGTGTITTGTNILIDSNTNNYITFRNTADNGTYAGLVFLDNNVGGYIAFGNAGAAVGSDSMIYGAYQDHIFQNNYVNETLYNRTETMRIKQSGNVGIGTSNPGRKLDVEGIVRTRGASGTGGFEISAASSGTAKWRIEWDSASDSLDFNWVG